MNYFYAMRAVLQLEESVYTDIMASGKFVRYCIVNVLALGIIHALFLMYLGNMLLSPGPVMAKISFIGAGAGLAFLMHAATALYLWVFTRGAGGRVEFIPIYFHTGISAIGLWPLALVLAAVQTGTGGPMMAGLLIGTGIYGLSVIFIAAKSASQLSMTRMVAAMAVCLVVVSSMLYLWL
jgi:hypothetical protein